ncbi:hypothetical protein BC830DRAFT_1166617 [Chytriomyces sp. MP71]|nr:hypothetical protein BC830DRAFT_1166617 [Chytriomyces sp. MP71]
MTSAVQRLEVVGRGASLRAYDHAIVADAGWNTEAHLDAAVLLRLSSRLRHVRIHVSFRGYCETRWEAGSGGGRLAAQRDAGAEERLVRNGRVFQQVDHAVFEARDLAPNPVSFVNLALIKLPSNQLPPSFESVSGSIHYYIKCSILHHEGLKLLKFNKEIEVPVLVSMPESAKLRLLESSSQLTHQINESADRIGYSLQIPRRIVVLGDSLEVNLAITSTPGTARLRHMSASLRPVITYVNQDSIGAQARIPRSLSEMSQQFPLVKVGGEGGVDTIYRRLLFLVDPELAQPSLEAPLISVKTIFRLEITIDNSETPNVYYEVPIIVVPPVRERPAEQRQEQQRLQAARPISALDSYRISVDSRRQLGYSGTPRSASIMTPMLLSANTSLASSGRRTLLSTVSIASAPPAMQAQAMVLKGGPSVITVREAGDMDAMESEDVDGMRVEEAQEDDLEEEGSEMAFGSAAEYASQRRDSVHSHAGSAASSATRMYDEYKPSEAWSIMVVAEWVRALGATPDVVQTFIDQAIDGSVLMTLTDEDLRNELRVRVFGVRRKILMLINKSRAPIDTNTTPFT